MFVPESCELSREAQREALTGVPIGQPLSRDKNLNLDVDAFYSAEDSMQRCALASAGAVQRGRRPWHVGTRFVREPGDLPPGLDDASQRARTGKTRSRSQ